MIEFQWYSGYDKPFVYSEGRIWPVRYVCTLTEDGYRYLEYLQDWDAKKQWDDRLCNNRETVKFGRIDKWVPDRHNYVQQFMAQFVRDHKEEIENFKTYKVKTQKQLRAAYKRKLKQTIKQSIKECKNGMH